MKSIQLSFAPQWRAAFSTILLLCLWGGAFSQSNIQQSVSINSSGAAPAASAMLDVSATDRGMLVPRMTSAQRTAIASPATGLLVFDTTTSTFWFFNGTDWIRISPQSMLADADGDTRVQVEKHPNEDIIRFDLGGTENMVLRKNTAGHTRLELLSGNSNSFFGIDAGTDNTTGYDNTAVGSQALAANTTGYRNTALGRQALAANTTGFDNTATGFQSLFFNITGIQNTATGRRALYSNTNGYGNTATGRNALFSNTTGDLNIATGHGALFNSDSGRENCAFGMDALAALTEGSHNVAVGKSALASLAGNGLYDVAVGDSAAFSFVSGQSLVAVGSKAAFSSVDDHNVTAVGYQALYASTAWRNSALGNRAMHASTSGRENTALGRNSLSGNTTGNYNVGAGVNSLNSNATGQYNTALGHNAYFTTNNLNYTGCFGYSSGGVVNASFRIEIGNASVSWIGGQVGWDTYSDARIKTDVQENVPGLAFISKLRPVTYHLDIRRQNELCFRGKKEIEEWDSKYDIEQKQMTGFIAQEVEAAAQAVGYDFSGVEQGADEVGMYSVRYAEFVVPLVKAVQEQQALLDDRDARLEKLDNLRRLKVENAALQSQLEKITAALEGAGIAVEK